MIVVVPTATKQNSILPEAKENNPRKSGSERCSGIRSRRGTHSPARGTGRWRAGGGEVGRPPYARDRKEPVGATGGSGVNRGLAVST